MTTALWLQVPVVDVPLARLLLTQVDVSVHGLLNAAAGGPTWAGDLFPHVVRFDGRLWLSDGHHRVLVAFLRGAETVAARVLAR